MADNNVIDELQLKVKGDANSAIANLSKLQTQLRHTAKSIGSVQTAVRSLNGVDMTFKRLGNINVGCLSAAITQLERLSKVKLDHLTGKKLDLNVSITGASEATREIEAAKKAVNSIDPKKYADKLANMFNITDKGSLKVLREQFKATLQSLGDGEIQVDNNALFKPILSEGEVARSSFDQYINDMKGKYKEFIDYVNHNKFYINKDAYAELNGSQEVFGDKIARYFTTSQKNSVDLNGTWDDMVSNASRFKDVFDSVTRSDEVFAGMLTKPQEQAVRLRDTILRVKEALDTVKVSTLSKEEKEMAVAQPTRNVFGDMAKEYQRNFDKNMRDSVGKIPLDVVLDENSVTAQIQKMIENASKKPYSFPIKVNVEQADLRQQFTDIIKGLDVGGLGDISEKLRATSVAIKEMSSVDVKSGGVSTFVNSIRKLAEVDLSKFDIMPITQIQGVVSEVANMGKLESGVVRLVSALARLANAGQKTTAASSALPVLGTNLHKVATGLASAGAIPSELNAFVSAISQLANAGNRTIDTAVNLKALGDAIKALIADLNSAPQASANLVQMTDALGRLASSGGKAGTAARSVGKSLQSVSDDSTAKVEARISAIASAIKQLLSVFEKAGRYVASGAKKIVDALKQIKNSGNGLQTATNSIKNMIAAMVGFRGIAGLGGLIKQTLQLGADLTEIDHIIESVFDDKAGIVDTWARNAIEQFGIAEHSAKRYAGTLSSMFQASQIGYMDAGKMSLDLVELAGDLSAFYNIDTETAFNKIRSGMAGMVRPLRDLGIDLTAATLEEFRLAQGIQTSYSQMSQAEKVMLRYRYLMETTKTQQGDFERTQYSTANAVRTLQAYVQAIGTQLGSGLVMALRHVIVWLNKLMAHILKAAQLFSSFMQTIFGKYKGGASGIAMEGLGDAADYASDLGSSADSAASGLSDASDAAKQLKKDLSVLPFDELNQLNKDRESTSSGSGSGGAGVGGAGVGGITDGLLDWGDLAEDALEGSALRAKLNAWATQLQKDFKMHDWEGLCRDLAGGLNKGLKKLYDILDPNEVKKKVTPWIIAFTTSFNSLVDHFEFELLGRTLGRGINDIVYIANQTIERIKWERIGSQLAMGVNGLLNEVEFEEVGHLIGNKLMIFWNTLNGFVHGLEWDTLGLDIADLFNGLFDRVSFSMIADTLATGLNGAFESLSNFTRRFQWDDLSTNISNGITTFINNFKWAENGEAFGTFISSLCDSITAAIDDVDWEKFGQGLGLALQKIPWSKILHTVGKLITDVLGGILSGMGETPAGEFASAIIKGLILFKIGGKILPFVDNICKSLTDHGAINLVAKAAKKLLNGGFAHLEGTTLGAAGAFSTLIIAMLESAEHFQKWQEVARGGNGMLTEMGTALDDLFIKMSSGNTITAEQAQELFELKEQQEELGTTTEEVAAMIVEKLNEWGISADDAKRYVDELTASGHGQTEELKVLSDAFANANDQIKIFAGDVDMSSATAKEGFTAISDALYYMRTNAQDLNVDYETILRQFEQTGASVSTAQGAYELARNIVQLYGGDVEWLNKILGEDYPIATENMVGATTDAGTIITQSEESVTEAVTGAHEKRLSSYERIANTIEDGVNRMSTAYAEELRLTAETASTQAVELENWQKNVQVYRDSVLQSIQNIGEGWGTLNTEQSQTLTSLNDNLLASITEQETALANMQALNESGLDAATVQAILSQVDPSSQAMTDLITHMQGNDTEWQTFHDNLKASMDLKEDIDETAEEAADRFATKMAEEMKPEFVTLRDDFKVEGGKIGEFTVDGITGAVFDGTDDAADAMRDLAEKMMDKYRTVTDQHSPSKKYEEMAENDVGGIVKGLEERRPIAITAMETLGKKMLEAINDLPEKLRTLGKAGASGFVLELSSGFSKVGGIVDRAANAIKDGLDIDLYSSGQSAAQSFANGFSSVYIPMPHVYASFTTYDMGAFSFSLPSFGIQWYRKGGLFMGGNGQVVGIGEDNRDEAVLPLEDRRAMQRIGSAIADAGGTGSSDEMVDRIAERLADIIMMRQDNEQAPIFNIEVKTENDEVLARAVERGQQRLDYRNNPTPKMAY